MSYTPYSWANREVFTSAGLNRIENGVATATTTADTAATNVASLSFNVDSYGAVGDGVTDDGTAIRAALAALAAAGGGVLYFPTPGPYLYGATGTLSMPANSTLRGVGTTILFQRQDAATTYTEFVRNTGDNVTVENIKIVRNANFTTTIFAVGSQAGLTLTDVSIDGSRQTYANAAYGFQLGVTAGTSTDLKATRVFVTNCSFALFQASGSTTTIRRIMFDSCRFYHNYSTDLEFNAPAAVCTDITVKNCEFEDNQGTGAAGGWAVGFANVQRGYVVNCTVRDYGDEAVHIEDRSADILIDGCVFEDCALINNSFVQVYNDSYRVRINRCTFRAITNTVVTWMVNSLAGGAFPTNTDLSVTNCDMFVGVCGGIRVEDPYGTQRITGNTIIGAGTVASLVWDSGNTSAGLSLYKGQATCKWVIADNHIEGMKYGTSPRFDGNFSAAGRSCIITGNSFTQCEWGLVAINPGALVKIADNTFEACIRPLTAGRGQASSTRPLSITGNAAFACKYPIDIPASGTTTGKAIMIANGAATVGTGRTLTIQIQGIRIPSGTALAFTSGTFTLTATVLPGATTATGDVTVADIASGQIATATGLSISDASSNNRATAANNSDSVTNTW